MKATFVDTSYSLAVQITKDQNHVMAKHHWQQIKSSHFQLVTTTYVFDGVMTYLNNRGYHHKAMTMGDNFLNNQVFKLIHVNESQFFSAWSFFQKHHDKSYSFTDCVSFVIMQEHGITTALTFDKHFAQAGFIKEPYLF